jgi:Bacterial Ig-like domain (group 3)
VLNNSRTVFLTHGLRHTAPIKSFGFAKKSNFGDHQSDVRRELVLLEREILAMRKNRLLIRLSSGAFVVTVAAGAVLLTDGVSDAAPPTVSPPAMAATTTTTTLSTSPTSPVTYGTPVTLTAKVTPATATGTVKFMDKTTDGTTVDLGTVPVSSNSIASLSAETLNTGAHSLTASFTPSDPAIYNGSVSNPVTFVVNASTGAPPARQGTILTESTGSIALLSASEVKLAAKLTEASTGRPVEGRMIDFYGGRRLLCQARTDANGVTQCYGPENLGPQTAREILAGYDAVFSGDEDYGPSTQHASATIDVAHSK